MFDALKTHWQDLSDNFYRNWESIKMFLFLVEYSKAVGSTELLEHFYANDSYSI